MIPIDDKSEIEKDKWDKIISPCCENDKRQDEEQKKSSMNQCENRLMNYIRVCDYLYLDFFRLSVSILILLWLNQKREKLGLRKKINKA